MAVRDLPARPNLEQYRKQAKELFKHWKASDPKTTSKLADAQHVIARDHGFDTWKRFTEEIAKRTGQAEKAAIWRAAEDAFVAGDVSTLDRLLRQHQKMFSTERPQSSWSGGLAAEYADGDARASIVRGHFFESWDQFAKFDKSRKDPTSPVSRFESAVDAVVVNSCLANGRPEAAEYLAKRGAPLDLEAAAGVGRLDLVKSFFDADGSLKRPATISQLKDGFTWACEYGRTHVVEYLLDHGVQSVSVNSTDASR